MQRENPIYSIVNTYGLHSAGTALRDRLLWRRILRDGYIPTDELARVWHGPMSATDGLPERRYDAVPDDHFADAPLYSVPARRTCRGRPLATAHQPQRGAGIKTSAASQKATRRKLRQDRWPEEEQKFRGMLEALLLTESRKDLAARIGFHQCTLGMIMSGRRPATHPKVLAFLLAKEQRPYGAAGGVRLAPT